MKKRPIRSIKRVQTEWSQKRREREGEEREVGKQTKREAMEQEAKRAEGPRDCRRTKKACSLTD